jgi:hypothetical protein
MMEQYLGRLSQKKMDSGLSERWAAMELDYASRENRVLITRTARLEAIIAKHEQKAREREKEIIRLRTILKDRNTAQLKNVKKSIAFWASQSQGGSSQNA